MSVGAPWFVVARVPGGTFECIGVFMIRSATSLFRSGDALFGDLSSLDPFEAEEESESEKSASEAIEPVLSIDKSIAPLTAAQDGFAVTDQADMQ